MTTQKNNLDDLNLDNFDSFGLDDSSPTNTRETSGGKREPVMKIASSFAGGAREVLTDSDQLRRFAVGALPEGYGTTINTGYEAVKDVRGLYNEALQDLRPAMPFLRKVAGKIVGKQRTFIPDSIQEKLKRFSEGDGDQGFVETQQQQDEKLMNAELGKLFTTQMELSAQQQEENASRQLVRDQVQTKQSQTLARLMESVRANTARQVAFQDQITNQWMRKTLELQYRQYFATRDMLNIALRREKIDTEYFKNIMKNTGLPDYQKLPLREAAASSFRNRLLGAGQKRASEFVADFSKNLIGGLRGAMKNSISTLVSGAQMGESAMEMAEMQEQMEKEMQEMGFGGETQAQKLGRRAGSTLTDFALPFVANPIRKLLNRSTKMRRGGAKAGMFTDVLAERMNEWAQSDTNSSSVLAPLIWMIKDMVPKFNLDQGLGDAALVSADKPVPFDNLTRRSIVEIIPGYLSRILREITVLRTGDESADVVTYNLDRGEFTTKKQAAKDAARRLFAPSDSRQLQEQVSTLVNQIGGANLTEQQRRELTLQMTRDAASGRTFSTKRYTDAESNTQDLSAETKAALAQIFPQIFVDDKDTLKEEKQHQVALSFRKLQNYYRDPRSAMSVYRDAGQRELLQELGIIDRTGFSDRVNYDVVNKIMLGQHRNEYTPESSVEGGGNTRRAKWTPAGFDADTAADRFGNRVVAGVDKLFGLANKQTVKDGVKAAQKIVGQINRNSLRGLKGKALDQYVQAKAQARGLVSSDIVDHYERLNNNARQRIARVVERTARVKVLVEDLFGSEAVEIFDALPPDARAEVEQIIVSEAEAEAVSATEAVQPSSPLFSSTASAAPQAGPVGLASKPSYTPPVQETAISSEQLDRLVDINNEQSEIQKAILDALLNLPLGQGGGGGEGGDASKGGSWSGPRKFFSKIFGGLWKGSKAGIKGYAKYASAVLQSPFIAAGFAGRVGLNAIKGITGKAVSDIFVVGETEPVMKKKKLLRGDYRDIQTKKPIRYAKDIKNPIIDVTLKDSGPVVTDEMIQKGFYTLQDGKPSIVSRLAGTAGSVLTTIAGAYGQMFKLPFMLTGGAAKLAGMAIKKMFDGRKDVYVRGQTGKNPVLRAIHMDGRHYFTDKGKGVTHIRQLDGKTVIFAQDRETILIGAEEYEKGLVDVNGRPLKTAASRIVGAAMGIAGGVASGIGSIIGGAARGMGKLIGGGYSLGGGLLGGMMRKVGGWFGGGKNAGVGSELTNQILISIHDMLDERLPGKKFRKGSWQERMALKAKEKEKTEEKKEKKEDMKLWDKMASLFSKGTKSLASIFGFGDDDEDSGGGDTTIIAGGGGGKDGKGEKTGKDGRTAKQRAKGIKAAGRRRGKLGALFRAKDAAGGALSKVPGLGRLFGTGAGAAAATGAASKAGMFGKAKGFIGSPTKIAATLAAMYGGSKLLDATLGKESTSRKAVSTAADVGGTALGASWLSGLMGGPTISSILGLGGASATTAGAAGAATTAGGALATAGGVTTGAGAAVTIGIPAAIAAIAGYGIYKGYKTYKYSGFTALRGYRMSQYGVDYNDPSDVEKIIDLESMLEQSVKPMGGGLDIAAGQIDMKDVYKKFGIDDGWFTDNNDERKMFDVWFNARFKPVYLRWIAELRQISPGVALNEAEDKLKPDDQQKLLRAVRGIDSGIYAIKAGPFGATTDITGDKVQETYLRAEREIKDKVEGKGGFVRGTKKLARTINGMNIIFGKQMNQLMDWSDRKGEELRSDNSKEGIAKLIGDVGAEATAGGAAGYGAITISAAASVGMASSGTLSAFQGLRLRAYGLREMDKDRVQLLLKMERELLAKTTVSPNSPAYVSISMAGAWETYGLQFGVDSSNQSMRERWMTWFQYRFMAVLTTYATKAAEVLKTTDTSNLDGRLKAQQKYDVAVAITQAQAGGGYGVPIWKVYFSPWDLKERLNEEVSSTHGALVALKENLKTEPVGEERASGQDAKTHYAKDQLSAITSGAPSQKPTSFLDRAKTWLMGGNGQQSLWERTKSGATATMDNLVEAGSHLRSGDVRGAATSAMNAATAPMRYVAGAGGNSGAPELKISGSAKEREALVIREATKAGITNPVELAMMLGQMAEETGGFKRLVENLKYRPEQAAKVWPKRFRNAQHAAEILAQGQEAFAEFVYGGRKDLGNTQPGDGWRFRGRGLMQLTGRANYQAFAKWSGIDIVSNPDLVATDPAVAAKTAVYWWLNRGRGLRQAAANGDVRGVTQLVNGGQTNLEARRAHFNQYLAKFQGKTIEQIVADAAGAAPASTETAPKADFSGVTSSASSTASAVTDAAAASAPGAGASIPSEAPRATASALTTAVSATAPATSSSGTPMLSSPTAAPAIGVEPTVAPTVVAQQRMAASQDYQARSTVSAQNEAMVRTEQLLAQQLDVQKQMLEQLIRLGGHADKQENRIVTLEKEEARQALMPQPAPTSPQARTAAGQPANNRRAQPRATATPPDSKLPINVARRLSVG